MESKRINKRIRWTVTAVVWVIQIVLIFWCALAMRDRRTYMLEGIKSGAFDNQAFIMRLPDVLESLILHFPFWSLLLWTVICQFTQKELLIAYGGIFAAEGIGCLAALPIVLQSPNRIDLNLLGDVCPMGVVRILESLTIASALLLIIRWIWIGIKEKPKRSAASRAAEWCAGILLFLAAAWFPLYHGILWDMPSVKEVLMQRTESDPIGAVALAMILGVWLVLYLLLLAASLFFLEPGERKKLALPVFAGILAEGFFYAWIGLFWIMGRGPGKPLVLLAALVIAALMTVGASMIGKKKSGETPAED